MQKSINVCKNIHVDLHIPSLSCICLFLCTGLFNKIFFGLYFADCVIVISQAKIVESKFVIASYSSFITVEMVWNEYVEK